MRRKLDLKFSTVISVLVLCSCKQKDEGRNSSSPDDFPISVEILPEREERAVDKPLFSKIEAEQSGVAVTNHLVDDHPLARIYFSGFACGGVVMADFNGDGFNDLFFTQGAGDNQLYLQKEGSLQFRDATGESGLAGGDRWSAGAVAVDIDGDHDVDLVVCNYDQAPFLFINDGDGHFTDRAMESGLIQADAYLMPSVIDYDRDGDLDLYFVANQLYHEGGRPSTPPVERDAEGKPVVKAEFARYYKLKQGVGDYSMDTYGRPDLLLRNDGPMGRLPKFTDVTRQAGLNFSDFGLSATWWDFDDDGWPDLHVGNDFTDPDRLLKNMGDGTFRDIAASALPQSAWFSMGADTADVDGDGRDDLFCADMAFTTHYKQKVGMGQMGNQQALLESIQPLQIMRNHLFINTGLGPFAEAGQLAGISKSNWTWGVKFCDFDLDGRQDLFVANGAIRSFNHSDHPVDVQGLIGKTLWDVWKDTPERAEANLVFQNAGDLKFADRGKDWGLDEVSVSHGVACGDLDGDGDEDLVVTHIGKPVSIFRNEASSSLIRVELHGNGGNPDGVGARLTLVSGKVLQTKTVRPSSGYLTTTARGVTFGLGGETTADRLEIRWPDGRVQQLGQLESGKKYHFYQKDAERKEIPGKPFKPIFDLPKLLDGIVHREAIFDDYFKQPLLPHKLSQLGRASVWGDLDGDGDLDLFHGAGSKFEAGLFRNDGHGKLTKITCPDFAAAIACEDAAAHFFDADGDGDLDLYVASGSYENQADSLELGDRLYLNDGSGNLSLGGELPDLRDVGSCVVSSDVDGDGDLDLFVGSRVKPGEYPLPATSRLLMNETSKGGPVLFRDGGELFQELGMVTDAVWADVNGDGRDDLLVTQEWGPVVRFLNEGGKLGRSDVLEGGNGWWTRVRVGDLDGDGDLDAVVGNFGLNTKYHASKEHPALIYYGDLTGDGSPQIIEAEYENEILFPVRGKSCSTAAMPSLGQKFKTFNAFAGSELDQIYPRDRLDQAQKFHAENLESGVLINDGSGQFLFRSLPRVAQIAPVQGIVLGDLNDDGNLDLVLAQNFHNPQFETGPYSGGVGVVLLGDGSGVFRALSAFESGVLLRGDPRGLELLDIDGDGIRDLMCPLNNGPMVWQKGKPNPFQ